MALHNDRHARAVQLRLQGKSWYEIGADLGVSYQRAQRMVDQALKSGQYRVHVQVQDAQGVPIEDVADYLRRALASAGLTTTKPQE